MNRMIPAIVVATALAYGADLKSMADETATAASAPPAVPPHRVTPQRLPSQFAAPYVLPRPIAMDSDRIKINLAMPDVAIAPGERKIIDLDVDVTKLVNTNPERLAVERISEKSLRLTGIQAGITHLKLQTDEHGEHSLMVAVTGQVTTTKASQILVCCHLLEFQAHEGSTSDAISKAWPSLGKETYHVEDDLQFKEFHKALAKHGTVKILVEPKLATALSNNSKDSR